MAARTEEEEVIAVAEQAAAILRTGDGDGRLIQDLHSRILRIISACHNERSQVHLKLQDLQEKLAMAQQEMKEVEAKGNCSDEVKLLRSKLEADLSREKQLQAEASIEDHLEALIEQQQSVLSQREMMKRIDAEAIRAQYVLTLCASLTNVVPHTNGTDRVACNLIDEKGRILKSIELNQDQMSAYELANELWEIGRRVNDFEEGFLFDVKAKNLQG